MIEQVTDISKFLSEMNEKFSSMEQTISEQGADISRLYRIIDQKDKEIHVLKKRLSKYEGPERIVIIVVFLLPKNRFLPKSSVGHSLCARSQTVRTVVNLVIPALL